MLAETAGLELTDEQADAAALLAAVAGQDVEADPRVRGAGASRADSWVISTVDPESRHAHKTRSVARRLQGPHRRGARHRHPRQSSPQPTPPTPSRRPAPQHRPHPPHRQRPHRHRPRPHRQRPHRHRPRPHRQRPRRHRHRRHRHRRHRHRRHRHRRHRHGDTDTGDTDTDTDDTDTDDTDTGDTDTDDTDTDTDTDDTDTDDTDDTDTDDTDTDTTDTGDTDTGDTDTGDDVCWLVLGTPRTRRARRSSFTDAGWDTGQAHRRRPPIAGGFTREDFGIDTDAQTVTCPAGHTRPVTSGAARFGRLCDGCPLRARCTTSPRGRSVAVDAHEAHRRANKARWRQPLTQAAYRRHRPMVERSIAWLARGKARRVPYRGVPPTTCGSPTGRRRQPRSPRQPRRRPESPPPADPHRRRARARPHPPKPRQADTTPTPAQPPEPPPPTRQPTTQLLNSLLGRRGGTGALESW